jgi:hypothetical protein
MADDGGEEIVRNASLLGGDAEVIRKKKEDAHRESLRSIADPLIACGKSSDKMRQIVDEEMLVPFIRGVSDEVLDIFEVKLREALQGLAVKEIFVPVKGAPRMKAKVVEWRQKEKEKERENWPHITWLGDALRASVVCEDGQSVAETWSRLRDTFDIFECKNNFATAGKDPNPEHWWTERPPDMLINGVLKVDGCMPVRFEVQVHHKDILERKEKQSHLLYEIQRAASVEEVRGSSGSGGGGVQKSGGSSTQLQKQGDEPEEDLGKKYEEQQLVVNVLKRLNQKDEQLKAMAAKLKAMAAKLGRGS